MCVHAQLLQSCLTLCDPMDCSPPGGLCPWESQAGTVGCHVFSSRDLPGPGIEPTSLASPGRLVTPEPPGKPPGY